MFLGWLLLVPISLPITSAFHLSSPSLLRTSTNLFSSSSSSPLSSSSTSLSKKDQFIINAFTSSDADDVNTPPSLSRILHSIRGLANGSDIRGTFVDHPRWGSMTNVAHAIRSPTQLTPFAAYCLGYAFATWVVQQQQQQTSSNDTIRICLGNDPRPHGIRLADAVARGCASVSTTNVKIEVVYTGIATTPSMMDFCCRTQLCDAAIMLTASHLPVDRNGMKFFCKQQGGLTKGDIQHLISLAQQHAATWIATGVVPPSSGKEGVFCTKYVDYMPIYAANLAEAIRRETSNIEKPLEGLKVVLHAGHGSGSFFNNLLESLGADVSASIGVDHDSTFPCGVPNPESNWMVDATIRACQETKADLGIMLDTDADRSGFIVPASGTYEPLHRNRLIALLGVIFQQTSPACTFVTDSVTSEGLADFLTNTLGLVHVRYLKGYANVIGKAKEITESGTAIAEVAIETSGHCAMRENNYLDDGTYTAVKVIGLLAKVKKQGGNLLALISEMKEMSETPEFRLEVNDGTLETTELVFRDMIHAVEMAIRFPHSTDAMSSFWEIDTENLEGLRIRTRNTKGGFFMLRKSLHDPILSLQVEGESVQQIQKEIIRPLLEIWNDARIRVPGELDLSSLTVYSNPLQP